MNVTLFKNMTSRQPSDGTLEQVANIIRTDEHLKAFTLSYRQTGNKTFKHESPLFAVACRFEGGKGKENIRGLTGISLVDFDHIVPHTDGTSISHTDLTDFTDNTSTTDGSSPTDSTDDTDFSQVLAELKAKIIADPHTLMCYTTMSGNGLRVIFRYDLPNIMSHTDFTDLTDKALTTTNNTSATADEKSVDSVRFVCQETISSVGEQNLCKSVPSVGENMSSVGYQSAFFAGNAYYERLLGLKADMQCKNVTRLSGLAHDPDVFLRPESEAVPFTVDEITTAAAAYARQSKEDKQLGRIQTYYDTLIAPQLAKDGIRFQSGSHNDYVMRVGYRLAEKRFSKKVALRWAVALFGNDYPDTEQVITSCFANASPSSRGETRGGGGSGKRGDSKFASVDEIKAFLDGHVKLRLNEITSRVEFLSPTDSTDDTDINWQSINDRTVNSLWSKMSEVTRVNKQDLYSIIESDYVPLYHPFKEYLTTLESVESVFKEKASVSSVSSVFEKDHDYIRDLAQTVRVKGGEEEQDRWYRYLRKWLVGMVASWISDDVVNNVILVLIGEQGAFKTTWFNYLLPPELKQYFYTKTNANRMSKDDLLTLAQYALVCCEELDTMRPAELNQLKAAVTMPSIDERAAYAHFHEHRKHIASFCGTGNNTQFLSDPTGNRRWLPFEVESIRSPREYPFPYEGIYAQALALYQSGFQFWFTREEIQELNRHNRQFETPRLEHELVALYFRPPKEGENGIFMTSARAIQLIGNGISQKLLSTRVGLAFNEQGFDRVRYHGIRGYLVVQRTADEIQAYQKGIALGTDTDDLPF